jgi:UDP-N-acetylglucosamine--N-acetylmuramyl-(pentapeptide) pyrophosphoryl-undecaprenol N-acetylglucosamine transferase
LISGGGTGGHVYPALAVAAQLPRVVNPSAAVAVPVNAQQASVPQPGGEHSQAGGKTKVFTTEDLLWVGASDGMEKRLVEHAGVRYRGIATGQLRGKNPLTVVQNSGKMVAGLLGSLAILRDFQPNVCLATGGYVCAPVVIACRWLKIPVLIYLPDMVPGWAIRTLSLLAQRVAVSYPDVTRYFGGATPVGKAVVTGYPVRQELVDLVGGGALSLQRHIEQRGAARYQLATRLGRSLITTGQALPLVLVWGGSQGSRNINEALWTALPQVLPHAHILHVVGERDWAQWQTKLQQPPVAEALWSRYHPVAYLHEEMMLALAAADLTVARAGASTLGEFPVARLPSLLTPHPGVNQLQNAEYLVKHGGAVLVADETLQEQLVPTLLKLVQDPAQRRRMEEALAHLAKPDAARAIAEELVRLAGVGN